MPKILLIEDNELSRDMLSRRLRRQGFDVVLAGNGRQGVELAMSAAPDLILMDMSLPVLSGWDASCELKSAEATRCIPIIALTAHALEGDEIRARAAGCDEFEPKPIDLARLLDKIRHLLQLHAPAPVRHG